MSTDLSQKTLLITGASKGLGKVISEYYLNKGWKVFGCARSESQIEHEHYQHFQLDITKVEEVSKLFKDIRQYTKHLNALINNAGIASMNAFALTPSHTFENVFATNVHGTFLFCQKALGLLKRAESPCIINMTTVAVPLQLEGEAVYAASKSAVETLTQIIAKEYGVFNIRCNAIGPSPIETNLIRSVPKDKIDKLIEHQAIKEMATPDDVTNLVDFFLNPASKMITGQIIYLGGISK